MGSLSAILKPSRLLSRPLHVAPNQTYTRRFSSSSIEPVDLEYDAIIPPNVNPKSRPLVIVHGLFGSKKNWGSLGKAFAKDLNRPVYSLDLRNHGTSPHTEPHTYPAMAADLLRFFNKHELQDVSLIGHSMGGKAAMAVALSEALPSELLSHLVVVDIAPWKGAVFKVQLSPEFQQYIQTMHDIEQARVSKRKDADEMLKPVEPDPMVRAFLLTNLVGSAPDPLRFRVPVDTIRRSLDALGDFPYPAPGGPAAWEGKTLFIKGERSKYINRRNLEAAETLFPDMKLERLDTSHWVHAEKPNEFKELVMEFVTR